MPLAEFEAEPHARPKRAFPLDLDGIVSPLPIAPFPSSMVSSQNGGNRSRARRFCAALRTLDGFPPFCNLEFEGKGAGSQGLAPGGVLRQSLMRASSAPPLPLPLSLSLSLSNRILLWMIPLLVDFLRALSPCFHPHSFGCLRCRCLLVFSFQGVLPSQCRTAGPQFPGSRRSAATSQSPQLGAFAYSADSQSFFSILLHPTASRFRSLLEFAV